MAQIIELLGDFPLEAKMGGKYSRELFDHTGLCVYFWLLWMQKTLYISLCRWSPLYQDFEALAAEACYGREISLHRSRVACIM